MIPTTNRELRAEGPPPAENVAAALPAVERALHVSVIGLWHVHARDYAQELQKEGTQSVRLTSFWGVDTDAATTAEFRREFCIPAADRLRTILDDPTIDGLVVTAATAHHKALLTAALRAGKHVFLEKMLATTPQEAADMVARAKAGGQVVSVALPYLNRAFVRKAKELVDSGELGTITGLRIRCAHGGALSAEESVFQLPGRFFDRRESGGGVAIDLAAHPFYLAEHLLGTAERVAAIGTQVTGRAVEDNLVVTMQYGSGALAVLESSFVAPNNFARPLTLEVHGTRRSFHYTGREQSFFPTCRPGFLLEGQGRSRVEPLREDGDTPLQEWLGAIRRGETLHHRLDQALALSTLTERVQRSISEGGAQR